MTDFGDAIYCVEHNAKCRRPCGVHTDESYGGPAYDHCWAQAGAHGTRSAWQPETDDEFREYCDGQVTALAFLDAIPVRQTWESFQTPESRAALMLEAAPRGEPLPKDVAAWLTLQAAGPGRTEQAAEAIAAGLLAQERRQQHDTVRVDGAEVDRRLAEGVRVLSDGEYEAQVAYEQETHQLIGQAVALGPADFARLQDGEKVTFTSFGPGDGRLSEADAHKAVQRASLAELIRERRREQMLFPGGEPGKPGSGPSRVPD